MVCSIDDIVSRRPGKHTRFPVAYSPYLFMVFFSVSLSLSLFLSFLLNLLYLAFYLSIVSLHSLCSFTLELGIGISSILLQLKRTHCSERSIFLAEIWILEERSNFEQCLFDACRTYRLYLAQQV